MSMVEISSGVHIGRANWNIVERSLDRLSMDSLFNILLSLEASYKRHETTPNSSLRESRGWRYPSNPPTINSTVIIVGIIPKLRLFDTENTA